MKRTLLTAVILTTLSAAAIAQSQKQHQTANSYNNNQNSHNVSSEASGGSGGEGGSSSASGGAGGSASSGGNSFSSSNDYQRQTATALGTSTFHTSPCIKSWGAGGQSGYAGLSLGGGKVDKGCDVRETAEEFRNAGSQVAFCKLMVTEPNAKKAGVTFDDCMMTRTPIQVAPQAAPLAPVPAQIIVPAPQVTVNIPPSPTVVVPGTITAPSIPFVERAPIVKHHKAANCPAAPATQK